MNKSQKQKTTSFITLRLTVLCTLMPLKGINNASNLFLHAQLPTIPIYLDPRNLFRNIFLFQKEPSSSQRFFQKLFKYINFNFTVKKVKATREVWLWEIDLAVSCIRCKSRIRYLPRTTHFASDGRVVLFTHESFASKTNCIFVMPRSHLLSIQNLTSFDEGVFFSSQ